MNSGVLPPDQPDQTTPEPAPEAFIKAVEPTPESLAALIRLCHVPRWTTVSMFRPQSVAEHSFRVAAITFHILKELGALPEIRSAIAEALVHDMEEAITGDIPATQKDPQEIVVDSDNPRSLGHYILKLADMIEAYTYLWNYGMVGPRRERIINRYRKAIKGQTRLIQDRFTTNQNVVNLPIIIDHILQVIQEEA